MRNINAIMSLLMWGQLRRHLQLKKKTLLLEYTTTRLIIAPGEGTKKTNIHLGTYLRMHIMYNN